MISLAGFLKRKSWIDAAFRLLQVGIVSHILLFPLGRALREISSVMAIIGVLLYYTGNYKSSNLARFNYKYLFFAFYCILIFKALSSINIQVSIKALDHLSYDSLLLFFPALEFVKNKRHLDILILAIVVLCLYLGLDALFQFFLDRDFFFQNPKVGNGRMLTATRDDPLLGNLVAIFLPVTFSLFGFFPAAWSKFKSFIMYALLTFPAYFFLIFSFRRTGYIAFGTALFVYFLIKRQFLKSAIFLAAFCSLFIVGPPRFLLEKVLQSGRWELWKTALLVWKENMFLGTGLDTFKSAQILYDKEIFFRGDIYKAYPHSLFVSLLVDTGLIGFTAFIMFFVLSVMFLFRSLGQIKSTDPVYSQKILTFAISMLAFLIVSLGALNLYSPFMMASPMILFGAAVGSCLCYSSEKKSKNHHTETHLLRN